MSQHVAARLTVLEAILAAQRRILRSRSAADVTAALVEFVRRLGGEVAPASKAGSDVLPLDLTFGYQDAVVPVAAPGSPPESALRAELPELVEVAHHMVSVLADVRFSAEEMDPITSLLRPERFVLMLERSTEEDQLVGLSLGHDQQAVSSVGRFAFESALRRLGEVVRREVHPADRVGMTEPATIGVLMLRANESQARSLRERVARAWMQPPGPPLALRTVSIAATSKGPPLSSLLRAVREASEISPAALPGTSSVARGSQPARPRDVGAR